MRLILSSRFEAGRFRLWPPGKQTLFEATLIMPRRGSTVKVQWAGGHCGRDANRYLRRGLYSVKSHRGNLVVNKRMVFKSKMWTCHGEKSK